ncbi:MAG: YkgJ family cysteine cluster protein [Chlorobi bacterium]|nr:YkgJ family cysteine cluster protein [Chlorobiota bacterium]
MNCRTNCGVCCIAPSINTPFEGMPEGKPSGVKCIHLSENYECKIFNSPKRPQFCADFKAEEIVCGKNRKEALEILFQLENN